MATSKYVKFQFPISQYYPEALQNYSERELRREYSRLRDVAQKRLGRLKQSEFAGSPTVKYNEGRFVKLSEVQNKQDLTHLLSDITRFLTASKGSVSGMKETRRKSIESLHDSGLTFVNENNFSEFTDFMEWLKDFYPHGYPSKALQVFEEAQEKRIDLETVKTNFDTYMENLDSYGEAILDEWDE